MQNVDTVTKKTKYASGWVAVGWGEGIQVARFYELGLQSKGRAAFILLPKLGISRKLGGQLRVNHFTPCI